MTTAQVSNIPGESRARRNRVAAYAKQAWSEAQQKTSLVRVHSQEKSMDGGNIKFFDTVEKRDYTERNGGITRTAATAQNTSRRGLIVKEYSLATQTDISDIVDASIDVLEVAKMETMKAQGRLLDEVLLAALVDPSLESQQGTNSSSNRVRATISTDTIYKHPAWCTLARGAANTALTAFTTSTLDQIRYIFSRREIDETICVTLTPDLEELLRTDAGFQNAENLFAARIGGDPHSADLMASQRNFMYKGFKFVYVNTGRLPILDEHNIGAAAADSDRTHDTSTTLAARGLDRRSSQFAGRASRTAQVKAATNEEAIINAASKDIAYFWNPNALYFAERQDLTLNRESELPLFEYAKQVYSRVAFGAMIIDDAHVIAAVLRGSIATQRSTA